VAAVNQTQRLMALLRYRGEQGVTPLDALNELGCFRLAARVWDLRLEGHLIIDEGIKAGGKRYARYVLRDPLPVADGQLALEEIIGWQA
jgi:hypothetical protein